MPADLGQVEVMGDVLHGAPEQGLTLQGVHRADPLAQRSAVATGSVDDCRRIVELTRSTGLRYMMMETVVYSREYLFVKELYDAGELGDFECLANQSTHTVEMGKEPIGISVGFPAMHLIVIKAEAIEQATDFRAGLLNELLAELPEFRHLPVLNLEIRCDAAGVVVCCHGSLIPSLLVADFCGSSAGRVLSRRHPNTSSRVIEWDDFHNLGACDECRWMKT